MSDRWIEKLLDVIAEEATVVAFHPSDEKFADTATKLLRFAASNDPAFRQNVKNALVKVLNDERERLFYGCHLNERVEWKKDE